MNLRYLNTKTNTDKTERRSPQGMTGDNAGHTYTHSLYLHPQWFTNLTPVVNDQGFDIQTVCAGTKKLCLQLMKNRSALGLRLHSLSNYYSSLYGLQGSHDNKIDQSDIDAIVVQLTKQRPRISSIDLQPMSQESTDYKFLHNAFRAHGWWVQTYFCFGNWYMPTAGLTYDTYAKTLSGRIRNTAHRKLNSFIKLKGARLTLYTKKDNYEDAIEAFQKVYKNSWKQEEPYPEYIRNLALWCAHNGWLRIGVAWLDEIPVAAQFWIVKDNVASIFKLAYDEEYKSLSTGTLLTVKLMQYVLDTDRVIEVDYLTGDDLNKKEWLTHRRERWGLLVINPRTAIGLLLAVKHIGGAFLKRFFQKIKKISNFKIKNTNE